MSGPLAFVPSLPGSWRYRDVAATILMLVGFFMLGIGLGSGYVTMPFIAFGVLPFALGFAHLWHAVRTTHASSNRSSTTNSHRTPEATDEDDPVALLKTQYAEGELSDDELDRRLERLVELDELEAPDERVSKAMGREK